MISSDVFENETISPEVLISSTNSVKLVDNTLILTTYRVEFICADSIYALYVSKLSITLL